MARIIGDATQRITKHGHRFFERNSMLRPIGCGLPSIPLKPQGPAVCLLDELLSCV
jgi:hypothetical protein